MSNDITELRTTLFATLRDLKAGKLDPDLARSINDTAQTIINTAKVEIDFMRTTGATKPGTNFIPAEQEGPAALPNGAKVIDQKPGVTVTRHTLRG